MSTNSEIDLFFLVFSCMVAAEDVLAQVLNETDLNCNGKSNCVSSSFTNFMQECLANRQNENLAKILELGEHWDQIQNCWSQWPIGESFFKCNISPLSGIPHVAGGSS